MKLDSSIKTALFAAAALACAAARAEGDRPEFRLGSPFSDHMVLQRDSEIPVWGKAPAGHRISGVLQIHGKDAPRRKAKLYTAKADESGDWKFELDPVSGYTGTNAVLRVRDADSGEEITLRDVAIGDVWICGGQSNMEMSSHWRGGLYTNDIATADIPDIRLFKVKHITAGHPQRELRKGSEWTRCTPEAAKDFSLCGFFFGRRLQSELGVPVGLLQDCWSGTIAETWISGERAAKVEGLEERCKKQEEAVALFDAKTPEQVQAELQAWKATAEEGKAPDEKTRPFNPDDNTKPNRPTVCYNGMIAPLSPFAVRGAIWYQGCSNAGNPALYANILPAVIDQWRHSFKGAGSSLPFYIVQLSSFRQRQDAPRESNWAALRWVQTKTGRDAYQSGSVVTLDVGDADDIHPKRKKEVGERLADLALMQAYFRRRASDGSALCASLLPNAAKKTDGGAVEVSFKEQVERSGGTAVAAAEGAGATIRGFQLAGEDRRFSWAEASADESGILRVSIPEGMEPAFVRYAWDDNPDCNLVGPGGLPVGSFELPVGD